MTQLVAEHALAMKIFLTIVVSIFFLIKSYFNIKKKVLGKEQTSEKSARSDAMHSQLHT